jgi:pyridoxal phosphate enzyme (YggS family)
LTRIINNMEIRKNIHAIEEELMGTTCRLIAVSKTKPVELLMEAYEAGCRRFGENKVQEMTEKAEQMPRDIEWHMIGHLQSNKVKYIAPFVHLIHSVDSLKLLQEINKQAAKNNRIISCLLQIYIAQEETKFGLNEEEVNALLTSEEFKAMQNIRIKGLMGMASFTSNTEQVRNEFRSLKQLFDKLKASYNGPSLDWQEISMGMSGDYKIAVEEGSTLIRVGSSVFGVRQQ